MALNLEAKKAIVTALHTSANEASTAVVADYTGMQVAELTALRGEARAAGVELKVVRNTLARRAFSDTSFACLNEVLSGPCLFAFSREDPGAGARLLRAFAKKHEIFKVKALALSNQLLPANQIDRLADLPTREVALARLMGLMRMPVQRIAQIMQAIPQRMVHTIVAVRDSKNSN